MEYTGKTFFKSSIKALGNDNEEVDVSDGLYLGVAAKRNWQAQVELSDATAGGSLVIAGKVPGASAFIDLETVDISGGDVVATFAGAYEKLKCTVSGLDAGVTCDIYLCAT